MFYVYRQMEVQTRRNGLATLRNYLFISTSLTVEESLYSVDLNAPFHGAFRRAVERYRMRVGVATLTSYYSYCYW